MANPKRSSRLLWIIVLSLCLLFAITYGERLAAKAYLEYAIDRQAARVVEAKQRQQALQQQLAYVRSDAYVEEAARNDLGMVLPGDELWVVVDSPQSTAAADTGDKTTTVAPSFWQEWLDHLGW